MKKGLLLIKPEAYFWSDSITKDIKDYGLYIDDRIEQRWTNEKIRQTYPPEDFPHWPMAEVIDNIIFEKFGKNPWVKAMIISSPKDSMEKIKKELIGPFDASYFQRPEESHTLRYKYGLKRQRFQLPMGKNGEPNYFYYNGTHLSSEERFEIEKKIFFSD
jgi:hypothetical protein